MAQIELINLSKIYTVGAMEIPAVHNVSLKVEKGDFLSIVGHSGSGKTTLISLIGGILRPTSGKILFENTDICSLDDERLSEYRNNKIGFMFQFASLLPVLTAKENVLLPVIFSDRTRSINENKAVELLQTVGVEDKINAYPSQLSGGQQRRVAIARALFNEPDVILADEPTGDLDEETEDEIMKLFQSINSTGSVSIILITHALDLAGRTQKIYRMNRGLLEEEGVG